MTSLLPLMCSTELIWLVGHCFCRDTEVGVVNSLQHQHRSLCIGEQSLQKKKKITFKSKSSWKERPSFPVWEVCTVRSFFPKPYGADLSYYDLKESSCWYKNNADWKGIMSRLRSKRLQGGFLYPGHRGAEGQKWREAGEGGKKRKSDINFQCPLTLQRLVVKQSKPRLLQKALFDHAG